MNPREYSHIANVEFHHWWYRSLRDFLIKRIAKESSGKNVFKILDIGAGTGGLGFLLQNRLKVTVDNIDPNPLALEILKTKGLSFSQGHWFSYGQFENKSYDCIVGIDSLTHAGSYDQMRDGLKKVHQHLVPHGCAMIQVAAFECLRGRHDAHVENRFRFTLGDLPKFVDFDLWNVEAAHYRYLFAFPFVWFQRRIAELWKDKEETASDVTLPPSWIGGICEMIIWAENLLVPYILKRISGTSLFVVLRKK